MPGRKNIPTAIQPPPPVGVGVGLGVGLGVGVGDGVGVGGGGLGVGVGVGGGGLGVGVGGGGEGVGGGDEFSCCWIAEISELMVLMALCRLLICVCRLANVAARSPKFCWR